MIFMYVKFSGVCKIFSAYVKFSKNFTYICKKNNTGTDSDSNSTAGQSDMSIGEPRSSVKTAVGMRRASKPGQLTRQFGVLRFRIEPH